MHLYTEDQHQVHNLEGVMNKVEVYLVGVLIGLGICILLNTTWLILKGLDIIC